MARIKITGYITPDGDELDTTSPTGLNEDAYVDLIADESGTGLKVSQLNEVSVELVEE